MSEKRFVLCKKGEVEYIEDNCGIQLYGFDVICEMLNEQQDTIITLKRRLEKINGGYGHLTHRNGLTANEWVIESQEKELKKKNEQISEWIEQHSKDIAKIGEQQHTIEQLQIEKQIIQNAIDYSINHQKTEIGKKALQKVIEKYNEQMLGHNIR